ncbi:MAG: cytochrome c biogenesis protein CcdA [bacterium]|nr:cytochrome c biogenesis protein CcdA [bacterium]
MNTFFQGFSFGSASILTTACLLPLYPGLIAFLAGNASSERARRATAFLGLLVLLGVLTMIVLIGFVLSLLAQTSDALLPLMLPIVYGLVIVFGVLMVLGRNPFARLQTAQAPLLQNPYLGAYVYGLFFGPMAFPCIGPFLVSAFALGATGSGTLAEDLIYFVGFGVGFGWPLVVLPLLALPFQRRIVGLMGRYHTLLERAAGILLIAVGIFGILTELSLHYAPDVAAIFTPRVNLLYWAGVVLIVVVVTVISYRQQKTPLVSNA